MNKCILIGRLVADPEEKTTSGGTAVSRYRLAVDRQGKKGEADFISCLAFGKTADFANRYLSKGMRIAVEGRIHTGSYEKDGVKHYTTDIVIDRHEFCESKGTSAPAGSAPTTYYEEGETTLSADDFTVITDEEDLPF